MSDILFEQALTLNENVFNNTKLKEVEELIAKLKSNLVSDNKSTQRVIGKHTLNVYKSTISTPENTLLLKEIEKTLGDVFNANIFINISSVNPAPAFTVLTLFNPISIIGSNPTAYITTSNGYRFKDKQTIVIGIDPNLFRFLDEREALAIILHEIGHNFFKFGILSKVALLITLLGRLLIAIKILVVRLVSLDNSDIIGKYLSEILEKISLIMNNIYSHIQEIFTVANNLLMLYAVIAFPLKLISFGFQSMVSSLYNTIMKDEYNQEVFADNFSASYGYGKYLISGVAKLESFYSPVKSMVPDEQNEIQTAIALVQLFGESFFKVFDGHPTILQRAKNVEQYVSEQLNKNKVHDKRIVEAVNEQARYLKSLNSEITDTERKKLGIYIDDKTIDIIKEKFLKDKSSDPSLQAVNK
jgi:hypothetical protein